MPRTFGRGALKRKRKLELYTEPISREFKKSQVTSSTVVGGRYLSEGTAPGKPTHLSEGVGRVSPHTVTAIAI